VSFRNAINAGRAAMDAAKGEQFTIMGVSGAWVGNVNQVGNDPSLEIGGFMDGIDVAIVASVAQFDSANVTPARGQIILYQGKRYAVDGIDRDQSKVVLRLKSTNR